MAPGKSLNLRGGSISPSARSYETSVIKVGGEIFDPDGYRMDVTVWFRHRNEALYCNYKLKNVNNNRTMKLSSSSLSSTSTTTTTTSSTSSSSSSSDSHFQLFTNFINV
ncbi:unnamed protein product [Schistosoma margrebowiei]|uniref:Uncharacterized protein n=1 Tax=Schistosoma margrebowiei TaxID=48269 RepID=A0A183LM56_9TREM|nr:unnamed protein product [Schistosoma margrebowiei]